MYFFTTISNVKIDTYKTMVTMRRKDYFDMLYPLAFMLKKIVNNKK
jgi:hypothetical protein